MCKSKVLLSQQLLCSKSHDFLAVFTLAHSNINQIARCRAPYMLRSVK
jgi:hypothetical protein